MSDAPLMTVEEIEAVYPSEWVLLADPELDDEGEILGGRVVAHGHDYGELERGSFRLAGDGNALIFAGVPTEYAGNLL